MKAPFPWFGGKRAVASDVWDALGDVQNYVEPFFGSGAVLLSRPHAAQVETVNDKDSFLANFWRAVQADPDAVAGYADWPVNEADLASRHYWLMTEGAQRIARCEGDPAHYDTQVAGWWLWGACAWIGGGWCSGEGPWQWDGAEWINRQLPHLGSAGQGINRKRPHLGNAGQGINRKLPHLGSAGQGIADYLAAIAVRLRRVRVACGDWQRVTGESVTVGHGITGVFLDPPYGDGADRTKGIYAQDDLKIAAVARDWAITAATDARFRIVFAGYDGEHVFPASWRAMRWKASGGYGSQGDGRGRANSHRETLWFSPQCISPATADLFAVRA